jgi:UDP-N-acetylglucosamine:LPS N-acetylglucosamine transferase
MTPQPWKVIVLYSRVGGGHLSAARALADRLEASRRCSAQLVDIYVDCGRFPVTLFPAVYAELARNHPRLWSLIYHGSERRGNPSSVVGPFLRTGLKQLMRDERPDLIVSVLPAINGLLSEAAPMVGARLEVVLTDWHSVHPFWQAPGVDHYTAPTESARDDCVRFGAPPQAVDVVGIPVRRQFAEPSKASRDEQLTGLGLMPERFTILAMVGAEGSPRALRNVAELAKSDVNGQLLVVCGHSHELRQQVEHLPAKMPVRALGYVENIADLMRASDLLITKAGGLTLAEAFCCHIPVVIHDVLPGQEAGNLEYVQQLGAVVYAPTPSGLVHSVVRLATDDRRRAALARCGAQLARPRATEQIVANLLGRLDALDPARAQLGGDAEAQ